MAKTFRPGDWRAGYYRDQTFMWATRMSNVRNFFAQLYGNANVEAEPASGGRQMGNHFATRFLDDGGAFSRTVEMLNSSADVSNVAGWMPRLLGLAYASKLYRDNPQLKPVQDGFSVSGNEVAFGTIGDAATSEGLFWEAINAVGVLQVPLAMSVWDDGYGISVPITAETTKASISDALRGFMPDDRPGIDIHVVRGWDYPALVEAYATGVEKVRREHKPALFHVTELTQPQGHSTSGSHERYKTKERLRFENEYDCVARMRDWIIETGVASESQLEGWEAADKEAVEAARDLAWDAFQSPIRSERDRAVAILKRVIARVIPPAAMPTSGAPRMPAPPCNAIMKTVSPTKNGKAYTASVKISQQNKPIPAKFSRSPRASMVVAPYAKVWLRPSTTTTAQFWICSRNEAELRRCNSTSVVWKMAGRRSRSAEFPNGDPESLRLVGKVVLDSRPRETHDADRHQFEHGVVAPERCRLGMLRPVRLESDLRYLAVNSPFGGDQFGALWRTAVDEDHVGMLGVDLVEAVPDQVVVVEVEATGQSDLWSCRHHDLGFGAALGCDELPRVDHGCGECAVVDKRSRSRAPRRAGVHLEAFDGLIAEEFETVATFDQRDAFGRQALKFDRLHLRAVLLTLTLALRLFVVVELTSDAVGGTMEQVDGRPEQVLKVRLEPCVAQSGNQGVEDVGDCASDHLTFGNRSGIRLVVEGTIAKELQFAEDVLGRRYAVCWLDVAMVGHEVKSFCRIDRAHRGLRGDHSDGGRDGPEPGASAEGRSASGGWQRCGYFASRCKARHRPCIM